MKLYTGPLSMFGRKVEIALAEKGIEADIIQVPFSLQDLYVPVHRDVARINPKGEVPVLVNDGLELFDSTLILEYLEDTHLGLALWPSSPHERTVARQLELVADEVFFGAV